MKFLSLILSLLLCNAVYSQETVYWTNGSKFPFKIIEASESIVKIGEVKGDRIIKRSIGRENVLVVFNAKGNYLLVEAIKNDPAQSAQQLQDFYGAPGPQYDLLVQSNPVRVIEANISYKSADVVNYTTPQGTPSSINTKNLALIIYKDGQHEFAQTVAEATSTLKEAFTLVQKAISQPSQKSEPAGVANSTVNPTRQDNPSPATSSRTTKTPASPAKPGLSGEELEVYSKRGIRKVDEFVQYLNIISDKSINPDKKDEAIEQAAKLFLPNATIEVSSANRPGTRRYPIKEYLTRLKLLPYSSAEIAWNEIHYVNELTQANDGNYYGTISGSQTFTGYGSNGRDIMYSDVTEKSVKVKLQPYQKAIEGQQVTNWEILLGNVGISVTQ
jgi:hypothetical protein